MDARAFLDVADDLAVGPGEPHWRTAVGRAYYALMLECRDAQVRWGLSVPSQNQVHRIVRLRFVYAGDADLLAVSSYLEKLSDYRAVADYRPADLVTFASPQMAVKLTVWARTGLDLLDQIDADPARRATAVAAMKKGYP